MCRGCQSGSGIDPYLSWNGSFYAIIKDMKASEGKLLEWQKAISDPDTAKIVDAHRRRLIAARRNFARLDELLIMNPELKDEA